MKAGTPVGGGILVLCTTVILFIVALMYHVWSQRAITANYPGYLVQVILFIFTCGSFGLLGLYDDLTKIFLWERSNFFGIRMRQKLILEIVFAVAIGIVLYTNLNIDIVHIPFIGTYHISYWYILFAAFVIVAFANAVNITDGLDGLSSGTLMISLIGFWIVARNIIDVPVSLFIAVWLGGILAFLYFNVFPARIMLGDSGALAFGALFALVGLLLGKPFALPFFGGIFVIEVLSSGLQLFSKRIRGKKLFTVAPFHLYLQHKGWEEPKIVFRMWIWALLCALIGLGVALLA
jgi:phospho-N-acetylmuramoyl-pentapeptide-transferase